MRVESVYYVRVGAGVTEINAVNQISLAPKANEKVVRLDVAVDKALVVDVFNALQQLIGDHQNRLQIELPVRCKACSV